MQRGVNARGNVRPRRMTYTPKTFPRLVDLAVTALACSVHLHDSITLPDELTAKLLRTMHRKKVLNDETVDKILHRDIRTMNLSGCQDIDVLAVVRRCNLLTLNLNGCMSIGDQLLLHIASSSPQLTCVNLSYNKRITDRGIESLAKHCPLLEELDISWCERVGDPSMLMLSDHCPNLFHLSITCCINITGQGLSTLVSRCSYLSRLDLMGCTAVRTLQISSKSLKTINVSNCTQLKEVECLNLPCLQKLLTSNTPQLDDVSIDHLLRECPLLNHLDLSLSCLREAAIQLTWLTYVNLSRCSTLTAQFFETLGRGCPRLKELHLQECSCVRDEHMELYTKQHEMAPHKYSDKPRYSLALEIIDLSRTNVSDETTCLLCTRCPLLKSLDLSWCPNVTDESLTQLSQSHRQRSEEEGLQQLRIYGCDKITFEGVERLKGEDTKLVVSYVMVSKDVLS
ncbi:F-box and leucine-rich repeat protein 20 [Planoprotostelium fungivorum]|uniref:F-box and leucine-rich repeat protein 20 n=1 Tax=Planoprotostelium fungivorum TaxID=1890364 RepID=A0A2P6NXI9_9EUKA|nr:F-box and leucine-rich repeat protein 20 [Planoprotostelium fungivorum]